MSGVHYRTYHLPAVLHTLHPSCLLPQFLFFLVGLCVLSSLCLDSAYFYTEIRLLFCFTVKSYILTFLGSLTISVLLGVFRTFTSKIYDHFYNKVHLLYSFPTRLISFLFPFLLFPLLWCKQIFLVCHLVSSLELLTISLSIFSSSFRNGNVCLWFIYSLFQVNILSILVALFCPYFFILLLHIYCI